MCLPKTFIFIVLFANFFALSSCTHYSPISNDKARFKSIFVHTISNQDFAPNIHILFQKQIRQTILKDKSLKIAKSPLDADTQLYVTIEDYKRRVRTRSNVDAGRFNSINVGLIVFVSLYDNETNSYLLNNVSLESSENLFFNTVKTSVEHREFEYQLLPKITRDLSENILELILGDWPESLD